MARIRKVHDEVVAKPQNRRRRTSCQLALKAKIIKSSDRNTGGDEGEVTSPVCAQKWVTSEVKEHRTQPQLRKGPKIDRTERRLRQKLMALAPSRRRRLLHLAYYRQMVAKAAKEK